MFGFGNDKGNDKSSEKKRKYNNTRDLYIPAALSDTFGTCDPEEINGIFRKYMPEITEAILKTDRQTSHLTKDHVDISIQIDEKHDEMMKNSNEKHDELLIRLDSLEKQNKELQEKVNALVDLLTRQVEKENGRGR